MKDEFRDRLSELAQRRKADRRKQTARRRTRPAPASLDDLGQATRTDGVLVVERSLSDLTSGDELESLLRRLSRASRGVSARGDLDETVRTLLREPSGALFVDTETTGLSGNMVFMLGTMRILPGDVRLTQVFARDYTEEPELLRAWTDMLSSSGMLVSFNGKSFDLPVLRDRLGLHGIEGPPEPEHLDLLHHSRRKWRGVLPDCRLQTLEWKICGRRRSGDIPGEEIPSVYHHFVRTGAAGDILTVFHHNALDLVTLADIALALAAPEEEPA